ncbi:uncharacterized protein LOC132712731 [Ruditapes philippinarum]|uniref:uncharacterized protein LOC132712731 n=1 Tax=Ruditapes philippinarum TaxID=129788 RepID=UPI00295AECA7|nr:uncharacterized protein LOC132712731 [Ruditapes philippinarum]
MIWEKLPEPVLLQIELSNTDDNSWTLDTFRQKLNAYIVARERSEKKNSMDKNKNKPTTVGTQGNPNTEFKKQAHGPISIFGHRGPTSTFGPKRMSLIERSQVTSGETLVSNDMQRRRTNNNSNKDYSTFCRYCEKQHWSDECPKYRTIEERKRVLKGSCYIYLKLGHKSSDCKRGKLCTHCGERNSHHRSLCPAKFNNSTTSSHLSGEVTDDTTNDVGACGTGKDIQNPTTENGLASFSEMILMQTVKTKVYNPQNGKEEEIRILLDSGSQRSYVSDSLAKRLDMKSEVSENINVMTFGSDKSKNIKTKRSSMQINTKSGEKVDVSVQIVPVISGAIHRKPVRHLSENASEILNTIEMADTITKQHETCEIEMLLGNDYYLDIVLCQKLEIQPGLYILSSRYGWILTGRVKKDEQENQDINMLILTHGEKMTKCNSFTSIDKELHITPNLEDFWKVESIGIMDNPDLSYDEKAMTIFGDTISFSEGRYQFKWLFKCDVPDLPVNRKLAYGRLLSVVTKLQKKPDLMVKYNEVIQD